MRTGIFEDEQFYICHDGRELRHLRTETKEQDGYTQIFEVYGCADCSGCEHKARCLYKYDAEKDAEKNKVRGEEAIISAADSKVKVVVIPTDEELLIASDTMDIVGK